ncbi:MAG: flagellar transcriptional regulator FlhD [Candidimonas sp.]|jgi:flagellar transcriptional activator FlhD
MQTANLLDDVRELNLAYLLLAQRMLREDYATALYRLGLSDENARALLSLSPKQLVKLGNTNLLLCQLRMNKQQVFSILNDDSPYANLQQMHTTILLSSQSEEGADRTTANGVVP